MFFGTTFFVRSATLTGPNANSFWSGRELIYTFGVVVRGVGVEAAGVNARVGMGVVVVTARVVLVLLGVDVVPVPKAFVLDLFLGGEVVGSDTT